jgi:hypothetical protein
MSIHVNTCQYMWLTRQYMWLTRQYMWLTRQYMWLTRQYMWLTHQYTLLTCQYNPLTSQYFHQTLVRQWSETSHTPSQPSQSATSLVCPEKLCFKFWEQTMVVADHHDEYWVLNCWDVFYVVQDTTESYTIQIPVGHREILVRDVSDSHEKQVRFRCRSDTSQIQLRALT